MAEMISFKAKELTVGQVQAVLDHMEKMEAPHTIELLFPDEIPAMAVSLSTGKSLTELDNVPASEMAEIIEDVKTQNPFFLKTMERLTSLGTEILNQQKEAQSG